MLKYLYVQNTDCWHNVITKIIIVYHAICGFKIMKAFFQARFFFA